MFIQKRENFGEREAIVVSSLGEYDLEDSFECGQCFRHRLIEKTENYVEYMTVIGDALVFVGQRKRGELIFYGASDEAFTTVIAPYFALDRDLDGIRREILEGSDSDFLRAAAECAGGIAIFRQDPWETLFSFIVSQNNNIPRIKKIIAEISAAYGVNLCLQNKLPRCPLGKVSGTPCEEICKTCGVCYSFPNAEAIAREPEKMLPSKPGFRYKYLLSAAERVLSAETDLSAIAEKKSYEHTREELKKICGVGDKVAACTALFGFGNLEAFPIDVWMRRAIDAYFGGELDPETLGRYAGVAQQYIFHYIRNIENKSR